MESFLLFSASDNSRPQVDAVLKINKLHMAKTITKKKGGWDSEENEAKARDFIKWGKPADEDYKGDRVLGVLLSKRQVPNNLSKEPGAKQWLYEVKVRECEYHDMDKKQNPIEPSIVLKEGDVVMVGGRIFYDGRLARVIVGQVFGLKYIGDLESRDPKKNDTKEIKVYTPRGDDGEFEMDEDVARQAEVDNF